MNQSHEDTQQGPADASHHNKLVSAMATGLMKQASSGASDPTVDANHASGELVPPLVEIGWTHAGLERRNEFTGGLGRCRSRSAEMNATRTSIAGEPTRTTSNGYHHTSSLNFSTSQQCTLNTGNVEAGELQVFAPSPEQIHSIVAVAREWHAPPHRQGNTIQTVKNLWASKNFDPNASLPGLSSILDAIAARAEGMGDAGWTSRLPEVGFANTAQSRRPVMGQRLCERGQIMVLLTDISMVIARDGSVELGQTLWTQ